jgi:hypothetical protein
MKGIGSVCEIVIGVLIIVFALWSTVYSKWIFILLGVILIVHSFMCKMCCCGNCEMPEAKKKPGRKR